MTAFPDTGPPVHARAAPGPAGPVGIDRLTVVNPFAGKSRT